MQKKTLAHFALLLANIFFGLNYPFAKQLMPDFILPFGFIFCRITAAMILFFMVGNFVKEKNEIDKKDWLRLLLCGFFGVAFNQLIFFYGLNITTAINASIIMTVNPVLVLIIAAIIIKEAITTNKVLGILSGIFGALILILFKKNFHFELDTSFGDVLIFINAISYAIYFVIVKPLMKKYKPITVIKWTFLFGFLFVIPFGFSEFTSIVWSSFSLKIWLCFAFVIVAGTFLSYLLNIFSLKILSPSVAAAYIYVQPVVATTIAILWQGEELNFVKIIAAILIFLGVYLVSIRRGILKAQ